MNQKEKDEVRNNLLEKMSHHEGREDIIKGIINLQEIMEESKKRLESF